MDFSTAIKTCFKKIFVFKGRASREEFWYLMLLLALIGQVLNSIYSVLDIITSFGESIEVVVNTKLGLIAVFGSLMLISLILLVIPMISASVRRLHDVGRTGWWCWISLFPVVGSFLLVWWLVKPSDKGENAYGPNPFGPQNGQNEDLSIEN